MPKRALLSVSDKTGLVEFAQRLRAAGYDILSTGGTRTTLAEAGIAVISVETETGFPECFGGRVKTMHPKITGGILLRRDHADDLREARALGIHPIDLVVVNLYPFENAARRPSITPEELLEHIDIGGPALLRSAAKNYAHVTAICDPADYDRVATEIEENGDTSPTLRKALAEKVFLRTAAYDAVIADVLSGSRNHGILLTNGLKLRYGENPHQWGVYYDLYGTERPWKFLRGKELSYLNLLDADSAWNLVREFSRPTAACIKHANPSGVASHDSLEEAFQRAYDADRISAFGVIIALNRPCTEAIAQKIRDQHMFVEVIIAPGFEGGCLEILQQKPNIRFLEITPDARPAPTSFRSALGGMLVQSDDASAVHADAVNVVTKKQPTEQEMRDLLFAWNVVKHTKSNAIVFAHGEATVGIGCGQTSRVDAVWIAAKRAGERAQGAVMASDAFFPFPDAIEEAAAHGISAVIHPGGSIRDAEVIAKADILGLAMVTTGVRVFRH